MRRAEFQAIRDTIIIVAFIIFHYPESAELWELVVLKARDWVGRSLRDPDVLTQLEKIARDNIDSASSAMPATGSSDVPTTPLKPARSMANTDIVTEKADEDNFKEHAVGNGAEIDTVTSRGKVWPKVIVGQYPCNKQSSCCNESLSRRSYYDILSSYVNIVQGATACSQRAPILSRRRMRFPTELALHICQNAHGFKRC